MPHEAGNCGFTTRLLGWEPQLYRFAWEAQAKKFAVSEIAAVGSRTVALEQVAAVDEAMMT